jgi:hypothetical protein
MLRGRRCDVSPTASCSKMVFIHAHNKPRCNLGNLSQKWYLSNVDLNNSFPVAILVYETPPPCVTKSHSLKSDSVQEYMGETCALRLIV